MVWNDIIAWINSNFAQLGDSTAAGYVHLPAGGAAGNILMWASAGTGSWSATIDAGAW